MTKKLINLFTLILCIGCIYFLLAYPAYCIEAAKDGLTTALYIVLPSIFPFMVLSRFIISSGIYLLSPKFTGKIFEKLFGINKEYVSVFILGCLGGYPVGSIILSDLTKKKEISTYQAEQLVGISNNASPIFTIGTVGTLLLNNTYYGYILYIIHLFSVITCGIIMNFLFHQKTTNARFTPSRKRSSPLSEAISNSGANMINIASYIIIFSVISKLIVILFKNNNCSFLLCLLEITNGIKYCATSNLPEIIKISMISFSLGFSGLCVFSQSKAVFNNHSISFFKYFVAKTLTAIISYATTYATFTIIFSH